MNDRSKILIEFLELMSETGDIRAKLLSQYKKTQDKLSNIVESIAINRLDEVTDDEIEKLISYLEQIEKMTTDLKIQMKGE